MKRLRWVAVLGLVAATFAACGDDDGDGGGAAEPVDEATAQADVDAAVARFVAELEGAGFTPEEEEGEGGDDEEEFEFTSEECQVFDEAFPDDGVGVPGQTAEAESGSYERSTSDPMDGYSFVEGAAAVVTPGDEVDEVFELLDDDRFPTCLREAMQQGLEESAGEDPSAPAPEMAVDIARGDTPEGVDDGVSLLITGTMGVPGLTLDLDGEFQLVRRGDRAAMFLVLSVVKPHALDVGDLVDTLLGADAA